MNASVPASNAVPTCHGGYENLDEEHDYLIDDIEGEVPADLRGTFIRNGPGRQKIGGVPYGHWFDGDGMLSVFSFGEGEVRFANRYVRTPKYVRETAAGRVLYRGFGTQIPGGWWRNAFRLPTNPANTSVIYHGGHLLALNEGGRPWAVDPSNLETLGEFDYHGGLFGRTFSAHGKVHARTGHYVNFGAGSHRQRLISAPTPCLNLFRIDGSGHVVDSGRAYIDRFPFCHDFALSDRYALFFLGSIVFGPGIHEFLLGRTSIAELMHFDADVPMQILVVDLENLEVVRTFETDPGAIIHFGNAFETGDEVVVDAMHTDGFDGAALMNVFDPHGRIGGGTYLRFHLNLRTGTVRSERMSAHECEFPTFDPRGLGSPHGACYTACSVPNGADSFFNAFQRVGFDGDTTLVTLPPGYYASEPVFAPMQGTDRRDQGYLLEVVYDAFHHSSELQIYRADQPTDPVCRLGLRHHLPHQFHGFFTPEVWRG
ncbi:MAG: carotenoid oxygenase family protein [Pseudomonadales bacterium]|jgi:all-trans-8'-apo-beta-carotenal 15,15'-oxygenase